MSNSSLVSYTKISPNKTVGRTHVIDTVSIHCVVGQCSVETLGGLFAKSSTKASSNYGIGKDGRVGMYVEEKDRSWCTSSSANDNRAVTIEVASDNKHPYAVNDVVYNSLINLLADICKRNGIKKLLWKGKKELTVDSNGKYVGKVDQQNMTVHRWFANKECPGDYLYERHYDIANKVNAILDGTTKEQEAKKVEPAKKTEFKPYTVRVKIGNLNVRSGPGTSYTIKGRMIPGVYTIIEEKAGVGNVKWGKLKSGVGWIALNYTLKC